MTPNLDFKVNVEGVTIDLAAVHVLCAQLTRDLFAIAKFLLLFVFLLAALSRRIKMCEAQQVYPLSSQNWPVLDRLTDRTTMCRVAPKTIPGPPVLNRFHVTVHQVFCSWNTLFIT